MDEGACFAKLLVAIRGPNSGWVSAWLPLRVGFEPPCPRCGQGKGRRVHRDHRSPVLDYRCSRCKSVFNGWTGTVFQGTHRRPSQLVLLLWAVVRGVSTRRLALTLRCNRPWLVRLRHRLEILPWVERLRNGGIPGLRWYQIEDLIESSVKNKLLPS